MTRHKHWKLGRPFLSDCFPSMAVLPSLYPRPDNTQRIKPCHDTHLQNQNSPLWLSYSWTKPVCRLASAAGKVWWAHRGHSVSHYPDDFLMAVWLDLARNDMPLSRSVWLCLCVTWSISLHLKALRRSCEAKLAVVTGWSLCREFVFGPVMLCSHLHWWWLRDLLVWWGGRCSPTISMPVSEMRPDTVPTLLPPGVSHVKPCAGPLSRRPRCEEGCWVCSLL